MATRTDTRDVQAGNGTVRLDGIDLQVVSINEIDLARFAGKITSGDYSYDSDALMSVWVVSSLVGGIGNEHLKEGVDDETYWTGTAETRYPGMVTLLPESRRFTGPSGASGAAFPIADFPAAAPSLYAAFGTTLARWVEADQEFVTVGTLPGSPANKGVEHDGTLWIPLGLGGYATVTTGNVLTVHTDQNVMAFALWDDKIAALTVEGALRLRPSLAGTWEADVPELHLPSGHLPRNLVIFLNQQEDPTIHVVTNKDVWAYDRELARLVRTQLQFPRHPDQGLASAVWRGDAMYVSVGLGIHSYTGGVITAIGPDGRNGLPAELRGRIVDLEPEYNSLIAVVEGKLEQAGDGQDVEISSPTYIDPIRPFTEVHARSTILRYIGYGWHPVWTSPSGDGLPTWALVSGADNLYRLWWGYAGAMYCQDLRVTFHNPKAGMQVGVDRFASKGDLITGWFDADMRAFDKIASHIELTLADVYSDGTPTGTVKVEYQYDTNPGWLHLGVAEYVGRSVMRFNEIMTEHRDDFSAGLKFRRIRFRFTLASNNPTSSPVIESFLLKFIKVPLAGRSWTITVKLDHERSFMGNGVMDTTDRLRAMASDGRFHELIHRGEAYRVRVAQTQGGFKTGFDPRGAMTLSIVEIPEGVEQVIGVPLGA